MRQGISLLEVLIVLAIISISLAVSLPSFNTLLTRNALMTGSQELQSTLRNCRQIAITRNRNVGIKFIFEEGQLLYGAFIDGNYNGLRSAEIEDGTDPPIRPFTPMQLSHGKVRPGILDPSIPDIYDGRPINNPDDPVKFGRGNICSFSPLGQCTPGTIYMTDGRELQAAVRVYHLSAITRIMVYDDVRGWHRLFE